MTRLPRPWLGRWGGRGPSPKDDHVVIFVHGILADAGTFDKLLPNLAHLDPSDDLDFWVFNYDFNQAICESADQLGRAIQSRAFGDRRIDIVGHSMGGLVARLAVLRNRLPKVARIVTVATPNHGTVRGSQLTLLGQMTAHGLRTVHPVYARSAGILDLTNVHEHVERELEEVRQTDPTRLDGKSYVSIPAQYYNEPRQAGDAPPSVTMRRTGLARRLLGVLRPFRISLRPVHDGIVEERSNQLEPALVGSRNEGECMPSRADPRNRFLHVTHKAAEKCDHVSITASPDVADLIQAVLRAPALEEADVDRFLNCTAKNLVKLRPQVL